LGYFSSAAINVLSLGFAKFLFSGGTIKMIVNNVLSQEDRDAIKAGQEGDAINTYIDLVDIKKLRRTLDEYGQHFFECLAWLISNNKIQFKIIKPKDSNGSEAGVALVIAATGEPGSRERFSLFIVDPAAPGYKVLRVEDKLGQRTAHTAQIQLDELRVPADNLVGEEGRGYSKVLGLLSDGRVAIAALAVGIARAALEAALRYAQEREAYGQPISALQAIRFDLAEMAMQVDVARQYSLHAARLIDAGIPAARESAMAKLFASEMAETVCSQALQVHGGYGYVKDFPVERYYRDVRVTKIYEGTSHIQKHIIARSLLG
jgi:hypothetical protein